MFYAVDSLTFPIDSILTPIHWNVDAKGNIYICDYTGPFFVQVKKKGSTITYVPKEELGISNPIASAVDMNGSVYISDNSSRRIVIVDSLFKPKNSFVLAGTHITPTFLLVEQDNIYLSAYSMNDGNNIHEYSVGGQKIRSFYKSEFTQKYLDDRGGGLNYTYFTMDRGNFIVTENLSYRLSTLDSKGKSLLSYAVVPPYFIPIPQEEIEKLVSDYPTLSIHFSKPKSIHSFDRKIFLQVEMPLSEDYREGANIYEFMSYKLDIYTTDGKPIHSGIDTQRRQLIGINDANSTLCFLTKYDKSSKTATVKWFKLMEI